MSTNKTIAKNTMFLYFRMLLTMGVGLFTSRLVLDALGVVDYGIYGLVGGIVTMFAFLNSAMSSATQRYLSFDIGKKDWDRLQKTFNATLNIHIGIAVVIFILAETLGLWFVNTQLDIPAERMYAANWVYQFSIFAFVTNVVQVPYNALLFAREHMSVYAYVSILETLLKLGIVLYLVQAKGTDPLILYAVLTFAVAFVIRMIYKLYCKRHFKESVYQFHWDKAYYKELLSYSGWNLFGNIAVVARGQGSNILLNLFFGPVANAAYAVTMMVQSVMGSFVSNFQVAINPQIIKNYAKGDQDTSLNLMYKSAKFSFFGMLILVVPFLVNIDYIMHLWLKEVPPYAIDFIRLALICTLIETISNPLMSGAQATGKIKWYQIIIGSFIFMTFPVVYIVFKITNNPIDLYWVFIGNSLIALVFRLFFLRKMMSLKLKDFFKKVIFPLCWVSVLVFIIAEFEFISKADNFYNLLFNIGILVTIILFVIIILGTTKGERMKGIQFLKSKLLK
ncbi:MAG TPA: MATE family efflux transporter [Moheibacter sp.]|nr:MATE family efflux transporter [Moheibacter sp.]